MEEKNKNCWKVSIFDCCLIISVIAFIIAFTVFFSLIRVDGTSMENTYHNNDILIGTRNPETIDYKDIIVFKINNKTLIKRVIAKAGDTIDIDFETGKVMVNGEVIKEDYIKEPTHLKESLDFPLTVPNGCYFVMGDNRNHSLDSRDEKVGFIEEEKIICKIIKKII